MAEPEVANSEEVEWTVVDTEDFNGEEIEAQEGPVFVAMQPGVDIPAGVEVQEVVIVTEGSETVQEVGQPQELPQRHEVPALPHESQFIKREREAPKIKIKKRQLAQYVSNSSFESPKPSNRGRPKGSKNITYRPPVSSRSRDTVRPPVRASLSRMSPVHVKQESQTSSDDSDSDSDEDDDDMDGPPRKRPKPRDFAHRLQWRNKDMLDAMRTVEEKKYTIRGAAKKFSVPYSTLKDRVHGRVRHGTKPGVKTVLSPEEEEELVRYVKDMEAAGFQMKCMDVRDRAAEMLRLNHGHNSPYKEGSPGHNWLAGFLKRHPGLEFKRSVNRNIIPSLSKQKQMVRRFFDIASQIYKKHKMSHRSDRIFAVSELRLHGMVEATILYAAAADGTMIPPFVIFRGRALKLTSARQAYPSAFFTCCFDGNVNEDSFLWWYRDHFMKHAASNTRPTVLYIGRSIQDITLQLVQNAKEERVHLVSLPRGVHHLLQPLDNEINDNIENMIMKRLQKWQEENPGQTHTQKVVAVILQKVWKKINPNDIVSKFSKNGLFPLNIYAISNERIVSASHLLRETYNREQAESTSGMSPLAGLNLLSALSSHEYASVELYSGNGAANQSFEQESDTSANNGDSQTPTSHYTHPRTLRNKLEEGIDLEETAVEENVVVEHDIIEEPVEIGEEIVESNEEVKNILAQQQETIRKSRSKPRPNTDLLQRNTNVQNEISEARSNRDQINRAIDSILQMERTQIENDEMVEEETVEEESTIPIKQEPIASESSSHRMTPVQRAIISTPQPPQNIATPVARPKMRTLRLVDGKLVDESGKVVDLSNMNSGKMHIEIKLNKHEGEEIEENQAEELEEVVEEANLHDVVEETQTVHDINIIPDQHGVESTVEEISNLSQEQINELISSGAIQSIDTTHIVQHHHQQPHHHQQQHYEEEMEEDEQAQQQHYVEVYSGGSSELPQQILQSEEAPQTILIDQSQLQQMLLQGGQVIQAEDEEDDGQQMVEYVQLPDGTIQEVIMQ